MRDYVFAGHFQCAVAPMYDLFCLPISVLLGMTAVMLILLLILLKARDPV